MMRKISAALSILIIVCVVAPLANHVLGGLFGPKPVFAQGSLVLENFALYSQNETSLDHIAESRGNVGSNGSIDIKKGASGSVMGSFMALGRIKNRAKLEIYGDVTAGGIEDQRSLSLSGQLIEDADLVSLALPAVSFSASGPDLTVPEKSSMTVAPGSYGRLRLKKGAAVHLASGAYFFVKFELDESARVNLDAGGGPVHINVVDKIKLKKDSGLQIAAGRPADIHLNFQGTDKIEVGQHAVLRGILTAPSAKVDFKKGSRLEGAAYAKSIHLAKGASFRHYGASSEARPPTADAGGTRQPWPASRWNWTAAVHWIRTGVPLHTTGRS